MEDFDEKKHTRRTQSQGKDQAVPQSVRSDPAGAGRRAASVFEIDKLTEVLRVDYNALFSREE